MKNIKTKEEKQADRLQRKKERQDTIVVLKSLQGEDIMKMNLNKLQKIIKMLSDNAGISKNGIIQ